MTKNPILICTFLALTSGFFGSYIGGQITLMLHSQKCQNQSWALQQMCQVWITPGATWKGSTTGIWTGTILGAFVGGLVIREKRHHW
ncbi:hypothetical protein [Nostoc sp. UHCC 0870]|uniref:hypothetical protein n=1 Tax=Nostoc sp. UHCC 0870 TaxID=2914041 RepID=UPI001EDEF2C4|nr:hypothetical protein [Nostoc sp. UHCC 0870]UKO98201.1 hypothetical protein L6494_00115 [Nostoc sp. UHCC 0870]